MVVERMRQSLHDVFSDEVIVKEHYKMKLITQSAEMLQYLHGLQPAPLIVRDLKPANILLTEDYDIKIGDLGGSRYRKSTQENARAELAKSLTHGHTVGSPSYRAPELDTSPKSYDEKVDIWSLALI